MSIETFKTCIDKIPSQVSIHFSGFCEPWQNNNCTNMLLYAFQKGHPIQVFSTLQGMSYEDFNRIKHIPFEKFIIHLPDKQRNSKIKIDSNYLNVLGTVIDFFNTPQKQRYFGASCHGEIDQGITSYIPEDLFNKDFSMGINQKMYDRAGLLDNLELDHKYIKGNIMCGLCNKQFNHNVLLPNGMVVLCCMDYNLDFILGNLTLNKYEDLFNSPTYNQLQISTEKEGEDILCRHCHNSVNWNPPYKLFGINNNQDIEIPEKILKFLQYLAERYDKQYIAKYFDNAPISFVKEEISNSIVLIDNFTKVIGDYSSINTLKNALNISPVIMLFSKVETFSNIYIEHYEELLKNNDIFIKFFGINSENEEEYLLYILSNSQDTKKISAPENFKVIAIIAAYNEVDIIAQVIKNYKQNNVDVYLIDNESTDGTYEKASEYIGNGLIGIERFSSSSGSYEWESILKRKEQLSMELEGDWFIHADADEIRESPWPEISLKDAIFLVDQEGYNCIDFTVINFRPTNNTFNASTSLDEAFQYFEFGNRPGHFLQIKAWKRTPNIVLSTSGGHKAEFNNSRVYPYKFLLRHYPLRSQQLAEKKIFEDRIPRFSLKEKAKGWHIQYDEYKKGNNFLYNSDELYRFDKSF